MADEATDSANDEQLCNGERYFNPLRKSIDERFLAFSESGTGVTSEGIAYRIIQHLTDWQGAG